MVARFRITVRGDGIELRGYVDGMGRVEELAQQVDPIEALVLASPAPAGYDPFSESTPDEVDGDQPDDLGYDAWVLLANGAYWDHTDPEGSAMWIVARDRWRDRWHATLPTPTPDEVDEAQQ